MAEVMSIGGSTATAKIRNPFIAFLLVFVTLGIYYLVWYYKVNRELRDLGRATARSARQFRRSSEKGPSNAKARRVGAGIVRSVQAGIRR